MTLGEDGPYGAELWIRRVRVRVDAAIELDLIVPIDAGGPLLGAPVVLFVQGGLVSRDRYRWLGAHLATRGFVVVSPSHALDLAFFEQGNALDALASLRAGIGEGDPLDGALRAGPVAVLGHSLGGVVAAGAWNDAPSVVSHLALLASYPASTTLRPRTTGRALSLLGTEDGRTSLADARSGVVALETSGRPVTFALIEGMSHMQFVDGVTAGEAANDGVPTVETSVARARMQVLLDAWLEDFAGRDGALLDDPSAWPTGVREDR